MGVRFASRMATREDTFPFESRVRADRAGPVTAD